MSRTDSLRNDVARLAKKEADLHRDLARHQSDAHKHASEASKKLKSASGTGSLSAANSYLKQARDHEKKAADAAARHSAKGSAQDMRKSISAFLLGAALSVTGLAASAQTPQQLADLNRGIRHLRDAVYAQLGGWDTPA